MGVHAYCVTPAGTAAPDMKGVQGATVRSIQEGSLEMWVSDHERAPDASMDAIREHNNVVVSIMSTVTPIPLRFGQWVQSDDVIRASLRTSHERWMARLDVFQGAVEFGLRIFDPERAASEDAESSMGKSAAIHKQTGTEYMALLARRIGHTDAGRDAVVNEVKRAVNGIVIEERIEPLRTAHGVASVAHLLHRADMDAYRDAVERVRVSTPRLRLLSTGPWPPYSFVE